MRSLYRLSARSSEISLSRAGRPYTESSLQLLMPNCSSFLHFFSCAAISGVILPISRSAIISWGIVWAFPVAFITSTIDF